MDLKWLGDELTNIVGLQRPYRHRTIGEPCQQQSVARCQSVHDASRQSSLAHHACAVISPQFSVFPWAARPCNDPSSRSTRRKCPRRHADRGAPAAPAPDNRNGQMAIQELLDRVLIQRGPAGGTASSTVRMRDAAIYPLIVSGVTACFSSRR